MNNIKTEKKYNKKSIKKIKYKNELIIEIIIL